MSIQYVLVIIVACKNAYMFVCVQLLFHRNEINKAIKKSFQTINSCSIINQNIYKYFMKYIYAKKSGNCCLGLDRFLALTSQPFWLHFMLNANSLKNSKEFHNSAQYNFHMFLYNVMLLYTYTHICISRRHFIT